MTSLSKIHCTQFMLDFIACEGKEETNTFQDYVKREDDYDLSFCKTWTDFIGTRSIDNSEKIFEFFMKIQETAMNHIRLIGKTMHGETYHSGIYVGQSYCVSKGPVSDFEGIKELMGQIWFDKKNTLVTVYSEKKEDGFHDIYLLQNDGFYHRNPKLNINTEIFSNNSSKESFEKILNTVKKYYDVGTLKGGLSPLRIQSMYDSKDLKKEKAIELIGDYLKNIKDITSKEEKISKICYLCRELEQLHLFHDGNGRSVFIFANLLIRWNGLDPFYPKNMCMFDANSVKTMVQDVIEGQKRFSSMFDSEQKLTKDLKEYMIKVESLIRLVKGKYSKFDSLMKSVKERNFNLLLRQSTASKNTIELLEFLLQNLFVLNIDINSKGEKSGTAMDVAIKNENEAAIKLLKQLNE